MKPRFVVADGHRFAPSEVHEFFDLYLKKVRAPNDHGLFTNEPIKQGSIIATNGGQVLNSVEDLPDDPAYAEMITDELMLAPKDFQAKEKLWYTNHSCDSNIARLGALVFVAKRDIAAQEELTIDYTTLVPHESWSMKCLCGSEKCRGTIQGNDWQRPELAKSLWQEWMPHIQKRILALGLLD